MSLKAFHLVFVTMLTTLSFGFAAWAFMSDHPLLGACGILAAILVVFYGVYFLRRNVE